MGAPDCLCWQKKSVECSFAMKPFAFQFPKMRQTTINSMFGGQLKSMMDHYELQHAAGFAGHKEQFFFS